MRIDRQILSAIVPSADARAHRVSRLECSNSMKLPSRKKSAARLKSASASYRITWFRASSASILELDELVDDRAASYSQVRNADWQLKPPWPCTAGIEKEYAFALFDQRAMRMASDNSLTVRRDRVQFLHIMEHIHA